MNNLKDKHRVPCEGNIPRMSREQAQDFMQHVPEWTLSDDATSITREYRFKDFSKALAFVNSVGRLAEEEWHHPDISFGWGRVTVTFTTHSIGGLAENDFIMATKVDALPT